MKHGIFGKGVILCMILICIFVFCSCEQNTGTPSSTGEAETTTGDETEAPTDDGAFTITIAGHDIGEYTIVYAPAPYTKSQSYYMETEYDFYRLTAEHIAECIKARTGKELPVVSDRDTPKGNPYEILVGPTNRPQTKKRIDNVYKYEIEVTDTFLTVLGGTNADEYMSGVRISTCFASTYQAWDAMEELCDVHKDDRVVLKSGDLISGEAQIYVIACIGDSITDGYGSTYFGSNGSPFSYPANLGRMFWKDCMVLNYGSSGATMRHDLGLPYFGTQHYKAMAKSAGIFDIAFVMLGTNDSYNDYTWPQESNVTFVQDGMELAATLRQDNPDLPIVIMNNPAYYGPADAGMGHVRALQNELYSRLAEQEAPVMFFDMYAFTDEKLTTKHFPDALHPDDYGYLQMAYAIKDTVEAIRAGKYTFELPEVKDDRFPAN